MKRALIVAVLTSLAATAMAETSERLVDAGRVFPMLEKFLSIAPADRSKLTVSYLMVKDGQPAADLHINLVTEGRRTPLPVGPDGRVERLPTAADFAAHAQVAIEAPREAKFGARLDLEPNIKPAEAVSAAECALAIVQANAAIHKAAGVMAVMAPHISKIVFRGAESGVAVSADGKSQPLPVVKGRPAYDPELVKNAKVLRFAKTPSSIELE